MSNPNHQSVVNSIMANLAQSDHLHGLLSQALKHRSWINEQLQDSHVEQESNERLEFLGDAVLGLIISAKLYEDHPDDNEGQLSKAKSYLISAPVLAGIAKDLDLGRGLLLGQGELKTGGRNRESLLADAMEAIIGAIYLASDLKAAKVFVLKYWQSKLETVRQDQQVQDNKTILQELTQKHFGQLPEYIIVTTQGPDHNKVYEIMVTIKGENQGQGTGRSKKEAEQHAAALAINRLKKQINRTGEDK